MTNQQLLDYVRQQLQAGISKEEIKKALLDSGWQESDIDEAFSSISSFENAAEDKPAGGQRQLTNKNIITGAVVVGLLIAGYFAWGLYFKKDALALAMEKAKEITSYKFKIELSDFQFDTQDPLLEGTDLSGSAIGEGAVDVGRTAIQSGLTVKFRDDNLPEGQPLEISVTTESISIKDDVYTRTLLEVPGLEAIFDLPELRRWVHTDLSELVEELDIQDAQNASTAPVDYISILRGEREEMVLVSEPVSEGNLTYYKLEITPEYYETMGVNSLPEEYRVFYESIFPVGSQFDIWINEETSFVERLSFDLSVESLFLGKMTITFSNINEPVQIEPPADFVELEDLKKELENLQLPAPEE